MALTTPRGASGFLIRPPVGGDESNWDVFRRAPVAFPPADYVVGVFAALPLLPPSPIPTVAALYLVTLCLATGVTHADGLADLDDAAIVHGDADRRLSVLKDPQTGVGGLFAPGLTLVVLALGAFGLAGAGSRVGLTTAVVIAFAAKVGAKAGMATLVCLGAPAHKGLGSTPVSKNSSAGFPAVAVACLPVVALASITGGPTAVVTLCCGSAVALLARSWGRAHLGGVSGGLLGMTNELARAAAVHAGVVTWTLS